MSNSHLILLFANFHAPFADNSMSHKQADSDTHEHKNAYERFAFKVEAVQHRSGTKITPKSTFYV